MNIPANLAQRGFPGGIPALFDRIADRPWVTLVELLLIGSVVYAVLRFLQGTRGARLVRAVLTILAVSFAIVWLIAERFELDRLNVLYPYFMLGVFLISLVAFHVELRRLLLRLGEGGWLRRWIEATDTVIGPVVTAAERLSRKKIGALIAIERSTETSAISETGVPLDATISTDLLETIFWPGTTLHDLGVIISGDRIVAAGCQFPLAESGDVDRTLGSRHRAAIGMSHEADAVVIVISEETGTISVATHGRFQRGLTAESLRERLLIELGADRPTPDSKASAAVSTTSPQPQATQDGTGQAA